MPNQNFNILEYSSCFQKPFHLSEPLSWAEHIPFAFFLIEYFRPRLIVELGTHSGNSYLAFCQAVAHHHVKSRCYAVDTWKGDFHAGFYDADVFKKLKSHHDARYSDFSLLMQMTFDEAVDCFEDGSIELLHIDGLHTYEAVSHDFENWFKKLAPDSIVLLHDINVWKDDFGVWKLWQDLKTRFAHLEFKHGFGLGVLFLGDEFKKKYQPLKSHENQLQEFFYLLGQNIQHSFAESNPAYAKLYWDEGLGFSEEKNKKLVYDHRTNRCHWQVNLHGHPDRLRFDPIKGVSVIELISVSLENSDGVKDITENIVTNAVAENGRLFFFLKPYPHVFIPVELAGTENKISIEWSVKAVGDDASAIAENQIQAELASQKQRISELKKNIAEYQRVFKEKEMLREKEHLEYKESFQRQESEFRKSLKQSQEESRKKILECKELFRKQESEFREEKQQLLQEKQNIQKQARHLQNLYRQTQERLEAVENSLTWKWGQRLIWPWARQILAVTGKFRQLKTALFPGRSKKENPEKKRLLGPEQNNDPVLKPAPASAAGSACSIQKVFQAVAPHPVYPEANFAKPVDIIIPVYNGYEYLSPLFNSLAKNTTIAHRLIIVHDKSSDHRVGEFLSICFSSSDNVLLLDHEVNQGFVKSINHGASYADNHFVILNSDTEVPPFWLERLIWPIIHLPKVATATPFTNAGTICSFPDFPHDSDIFERLDVESVDWAFAHIRAQNNFLAIPTGIGFCMAVNKSLWDSMGPFDAETFGAGYGEENDWCQKAQKQGYANVQVPNLFVYHKHGGSFLPQQKENLLSENLKKLQSRYPSYIKKVESFIRSDPRKCLRQWMVVLLSATFCSEKTVLMVDHQHGGGATIFRDQYIDRLLEHDQKCMLVTFRSKNNTFTARYFHNIHYQPEFFLQAPEDLLLLSDYIKFDKIVLNSLVFSPDPLELLRVLLLFKTKTMARLQVCFHDYFPICPDWKLLDKNNRYCRVKSPEQCRNCLKNNPNIDKLYQDFDIEDWRQKWFSFLSVATEILCFSDASKKILLSAYPRLNTANIKVVPHTVDYVRPVRRSDNGTKLRIGVIGAINMSKGLGIIKDMGIKIYRQSLPVEIIIIGYVDQSVQLGDASSVITITGRYAREDLPDLVEKYEIDIIFIPSIWPETFSYTAEEAMQMKLPVAVFDLGAPSERVRLYDQGLVIESVDPDLALERIMSMKK